MNLRPHGRSRLAGVAAALILATAAPGASAATGDLTQKLGTLGCLGAPSGCGAAPALDGATAVTVSPDGRSAYAASSGSDAVTVFDRAADGSLTQKPGITGCVSETGSGGACTDGRALDFAQAVAVSPDGTSVYVGSGRSNAVAVFDRAADGSLTQKPGAAGCLSDSGGGGWSCAVGNQLEGINGVRVSPDGRNVYLAASSDNAVVVLDRAANGALTQKPGAAGCVSSNSGAGCAAGRGLFSAGAVAVSPDGASVYTAALNDGVALFDRAHDGTLTQKPGAAGCITEDGTGTPGAAPCTVGAAVGAPTALVVSPDGEGVYVTSRGTDALLSFDRAAGGALTQKPGVAGCVSDSGSAGACVDGRALSFPLAVGVSPDGRSLYVAAGFSDAVSSFDRATDGTLTQKAGLRGCVSETGTGGLCTNGRALDGAGGVAVDSSGRTVYVASSTSDAVAVLDREPALAPDPAVSGPPSPPAVPAGPSAPLPLGPLGPPAAGTPFAAKLAVRRATVLRAKRRLSVLAPITGRASGTVSVAFRAAGRTERFSVKVDARNRRVRIDRRIPRAQARLGTGILTMTYPGDEDTQPQEVRLRAASRQARLVADRPKLSGNRLRAKGRISTRARGVVRLQVLYEPAGKETETLSFTTRIRNGTYAFDEKLPASVVAGIDGRRGVVHTYTLFTGYFPARVRGEMRSYQLLGARLRR